MEPRVWTSDLTRPGQNRRHARPGSTLHALAVSRMWRYDDNEVRTRCRQFCLTCRLSLYNRKSELHRSYMLPNAACHVDNKTLRVISDIGIGVWPVLLHYLTRMHFCGQVCLASARTEKRNGPAKEAVGLLSPDDGSVCGISGILRFAGPSCTRKL